MSEKGLIPLLILALSALGMSAIVVFTFFGLRSKPPSPSQAQRIVSLQPSEPFSTPQKEEPFRTYTAPEIKPKDVYTIFLMGDSMTHALGPHGGKFNEFLHAIYKNKSFLIDNYAVGSTNVLSLKDGLKRQVTYWDSAFGPLLDRDFDLILLESFGYNPLSQFPIEEGLKKQTEALDETMTTLINTHPNAAIVFVATIAPSKAKYAQGIIKLTPEERALQAEERMSYIKNHISYAKSHNIPLINIYEKSLSENGDGDLSYINPDDYIHPSFKGIDLISNEMANFIYGNNILPR